jgi:AcrR family transcriptional regulator
MLDIVAERGYGGVTVRELAARAGVSTRSFYQHYPNLETCFLSVYQVVVRRVLRGIEAAALGAHDANRRLRRVVGGLVDEWASDPNAARLMLLDAYAGGLPALKRARLAARSIEARVGECLDYPRDAASLAPLAAESIVAGILTAARSCLLDGEGDLGDLADPLGGWAAAYHELPAEQIEEAKSLSHRVPANGGDDASSGVEERLTVAPEGDRALLLTAAARLVASQRKADLGLEDIASTAGISRRGFEVEFSDPEACIAAAHRLYADRLIDRVVRAEKLVAAGDACHPLALLGSELATDPTLAVLCFSDVAIAGPRLVRSHQRFLARVACLAAGTTEPAGPTAEASAGALWGSLRQRVVMGRAAQAQELARALTSLALLPLQAASQLSAS